MASYTKILTILALFAFSGCTLYKPEPVESRGIDHPDDVGRPPINTGRAADSSRPPPAPVPVPVPVPVPPPIENRGMGYPHDSGAPAPAPPPLDLKSSGNLYPVWYGTTRKTTTKYNGETIYTKDRGQSTKYGKAFVKISKDYLDSFAKNNIIENLIHDQSESHLKIRNTLPMTSAEFFEDLRSQIHSKSNNEEYCVVYIHGFRTTFEEAIQRSASIGYQLRVPTMISFSWPSKGSTSAYIADQQAAKTSAELLAEFLIKISKESHIAKIHIIAHSMGNYALLEAMLRPSMQAAIGKGLRFGQIILAAPDVDAEEFMQDASIYTRIADRVTLYASTKDKALIASKTLSNYPRAGLLPPPIILPKMDTIDVSSANLSWTGHIYVAEEIDVLLDMYRLISNNLPPSERPNIQPVQNGVYWKIR